MAPNPNTDTHTQAQSLYHTNSINAFSKLYIALGLETDIDEFEVLFRVESKTNKAKQPQGVNSVNENNTFFFDIFLFHVS